MRIFAFHLLNDYSGSPKVLMQLAKGWVKEGLDVTISTSKGGKGFLSGLNGVTKTDFWYRWHKNPFIRMFNLLVSQMHLIVLFLGKVKPGDIVYVNTVLPFGAAVLGRIKGARVIYHVHETTVNPALLRMLLFGILNLMADEVIFVSEYLNQTSPVKTQNRHVVHNAIETEFLINAKQNLKQEKTYSNVLMVCSLKWYKGVNEYVQLAIDNPDYLFRLVLNARSKEIDGYFKNVNLPENLKIIPVQTNLHPYYKWADILLNLSRPDGWIETFGLTVIEGMCYGLPAIVPPVGGITEVVDDGFNGFLVDSRDSKKLNSMLHEVLSDKILYNKLKENTAIKIKEFREERFISKSLEILRYKKNPILKLEKSTVSGNCVFVNSNE